MAAMVKKTATEGVLSEIHSLTAQQMRARLQQAIETGSPLPPAELAVIVKFLKDNSIECTKDDMKAKFGDLLVMEGPQFDELEEKYG